MKSLAELKRDAKAKKLEGRMVLRCGEADIPERLKGWRRIVNSNTVSIMFEMPNGKTSRLDLPASSLVEYTDDSLTIYEAGYRDLNPHEQAIFNEWDKISSDQQFKRRREIDLLTDGTSTYYEEKYFFKKHNAEYLMGLHEQRGMKWDFYTHKVRDNRIKGNVSMKYELRCVE